MNNLSSKTEKKLSFSFSTQTDFSDSLKNFDSNLSFFGRIIESPDSGIGELFLFLNSPDTFDIGTLSELFVSSVKESGKLNLFLNPPKTKNSLSNSDLIEIWKNIIADKIIYRKENNDKLLKNLEIQDLAILNDYFRLRHALRLFIEICMIIKSNELISEAENNLNELDFLIYKYLNLEQLAKISKLRSEPEFVPAKFAELCSWAVLSNFFSVEKSSSIMALTPEIINDNISELESDTLGLSASAFCFAGKFDNAIKYLTKSFSICHPKTTLGWNTFALTRSIIGISPDYYGLKISPSSHFSLNGLRLQRYFRGKKLNIIINHNRDMEKNKTKIILNGEEYQGSIVHISDLQIDNNIVVERRF